MFVIRIDKLAVSVPGQWSVMGSDEGWWIVDQNEVPVCDSQFFHEKKLAAYVAERMNREEGVACEKTLSPF